jgi:4'-phosphopantetheinyl transferase
LYEELAAGLRDRDHAASFRAVPEPVEIWTVPLDPPEAEVRRLYDLLSAVERERAGAAPLQPRKRRYVARQGALREILGHYLEVPPEEVQLARSNGGKPILVGRDDLRFSVSDSGDLALVAVSRREIGVDVEQVRERPASVRSPLGTESFFAHWTKLEAIGKARGTGLLRPHGGDGAFTCTSLDVGRGFAAAVAVAAERIRVRVRPY